MEEKWKCHQMVSSEKIHTNNNMHAEKVIFRNFHRQPHICPQQYSAIKGSWIWKGAREGNVGRFKGMEEKGKLQLYSQK